MIDVEQIVADTLAICAFAAPTGQEQARAAYLADRLRDYPYLDVQIDHAGNVLARLPAATIGTAQAAHPAVVVAAHLDTVFGAEVVLRPLREDGVLRGPGIGDNSLAVATLLALAREMAGWHTACDVVLAGTVGEEGLGNLRGARALLETVPSRCLIALEGHGIEQLTTQGVGSVRLAVTYIGPGGHSWGHRGAPSTVHALARATARVVDELAGALPEVAVNVGLFQGGTGINVIAARAALQLDLRALEAGPLQRAEALARALFTTVAEEQGVHAVIDLLGSRAAGGIPDDHPLVRAAQRARLAAGLPEAALQESSTDANAAYERGIPAVTLRLTSGAGTHRTDEYIEIAPIGAGVQAVLNLLVALAADDSPWDA